MRRIAAFAFVTMLLAGGAAAQPAHHGADSTLALSPVTAVFVQADLATKYSVEALPLAGPAKLTYVWKLQLKLVNRAGAPAPGNIGKAALDETCDNEKLAGGKTVAPDEYVWTNQGDAFIWYHGDAGSYPGSGYGCDHTKMGPSGHQGLVSVTVSDGKWACTASIAGSNLSPDPIKGREATCVQAGGLAPHAPAALLKGFADADAIMDKEIAQLTGGPLTTEQLHAMNAAGKPSAYFTLLHAFERNLPKVGARKVALGPVFDKLSVADIELGSVPGLLDPDGRQYVKETLDRAANYLRDGTKALEKSPDLKDLGTEYGDLADSIDELGRQFDEKTVTDSQVRAKVKQLEKEKVALLAKLPTIYGLPAKKLYEDWEAVLDELNEASRGLIAGNQSAATAHTKQARTLKKKLEAELAHAAAK